MKLGRGRFGNVISLGMRAGGPGSGPVTYPAVSQVDAYWEGLRDGRLMPKRSEVDPRGLEGALEYALLMEMVAPGVARVRVSGLHLTDLLGMEVRGMPLTAFFEPADRNRVADLLQDVVTGPKVVEMELISPSGIGRPALTAKLFLAPLEAENDHRPRLLACLQAKGEIGRTPRRLKIKDVHTRRIVASAQAPTQGGASETLPIRPDPLRLPEEQRVPGFADATRDFVPGATSDAPRAGRTYASERPYLRLVKTDA